MDTHRAVYPTNLVPLMGGYPPGGDILWNGCPPLMGRFHPNGVSYGLDTRGAEYPMNRMDNQRVGYPTVWLPAETRRLPAGRSILLCDTRR